MAFADRFKINFFTCLIVTAVLLSGLNAAGEIQTEPASLLPADTFLYLVIPEGVTNLQEKLKNTSLWGLYKDPAMQRFIEPAEKAIREKFDERLEKTWKELSMDQPPEEFPLPTGRVIFAMRMGTTDSNVPEPAPQFVLIAQMGQNMITLKEIAEQAAEKAVEAGAKRLREDVRGVQMETITPAPPESDDGQHNHSTQHQPLCYAFAEQTALVSNDPDMLRDVLARMGGAQLDSLADNSQMNEILQGLEGPADIIAYFNINSLISSLMDIIPVEARARAQTMITALGLDNVQGLGMLAQITPSPTEELRLKALLAVNGEKRGIVALLTPTSVSTSGHHLLTKGLASFVVANYDPETILNRINQIMQAMGKPDINILLAQIMTVTALNDPAGRPAVDLQTEVIGQLNAPLTILNRLDKPYTDPTAGKSLVALGVRDAAILETALGRIHQTFIAAGNKELQRELLGSKIFLLPNGAIFGSVFGPNQKDAGIAFAVAGNNLVIGDVDSVEQAIRDLRREDLQPIQSDPLYSQAARHLPAQSGVWSYENQQMTTELLWTQLKELARMQLDSPSDTDDPGMNRFLMIFEEIFDGFEDFAFGTLPDFEVVKKYFGALIGHMKETERGLYFESLLIKAQ